MYRTRRYGNVSIVTMSTPFKQAFEQRFLITADRHWDNQHSDQAMQIRHMDEAVECGAGIIDIGDLFCAMQGKWDKRSSKEALRPEHKRGDYLDALVETAAEFFGPYAESFIRLAYGNHETGVLKRHETDLTARLVRALNEKGGSIHHGGISGWVQFRFLDENRHAKQYKAWYHHGYGGGGPVTRGVIQSNRKAVYVPDANFVFSGHVHEEWTLTIPRTRLTDGGVQYQDEQLHLQVPTYKDEYGSGFGGWHVETGKPPKPLGALWLIFRKAAGSGVIDYEIKRAK